jgi:hypothetical protein
MDLISLTIGLPLAPIRGLLALARLLQDEADRELYSPTRVRRELEEIEAAQSRAELSDEAAEAEAQKALDRLVNR